MNTMSTIFEEVNVINQEVNELDLSTDYISDSVEILTPDDLFMTCVTDADDDFTRYENDIGDVPKTPPTKEPPTSPPPILGKKRCLEHLECLEKRTKIKDWDY